MSFCLPILVKKGYPIANLSSTCRLYGKNVLRRRAVRVLNVPPETLEPVHNEELKKVRLTTRSDSNELEVLKKESQSLVVPGYEKLQKNDSRFTKVIHMIKNRKLRERKGKIFLEGIRLINDAIDAGVELQTIYFSREKELAAIKFKDQNKVEIFKVFYKTLQIWSDLTTCPGIMGIFKRPTIDNIHIMSEPVIPVTIICDNVRDPGNLGSIIRNAAAAGCENILLLKGCVDPWESKVLKTGCGGHFRIPIINDIDWSHINNYIHKDSSIVIADNTADISEHSSGAEFISFDESIEENEEEKRYISINSHEQPVSIDETFNEPTELEKYEDIVIPCYLYSSLTYPKKNIVLYIGGETHGVDPRVKKLACEYGGKKVKVPLENNMDSLNSAFAATLILYEIKRQFGETYVTKTSGQIASAK